MSNSRMIEAAKCLNLEAARELLSANPSRIGVRHRDGRNLLHLACSTASEKLGLPRTAAVAMARLLLDNGLGIDTRVGNDACTALFFAVARARNPMLVKFLLNRGATPAAAPGGGLFAAAWFDDVYSLRLLIDAGAFVDVVVGETPFHASWCWRRFKAAKFLVTRGADVNFQDAKGLTALHRGVEKGFDPALLRWLVRHGASPNITDRRGISAMALAARKRDKRFQAALA